MFFFFFCISISYCCFFFFFQAEDGIRDLTVTGVQTCALPICADADLRARKQSVKMRDVAVMNLRRIHVPIFQPLLQLSGMSYLIWCETCAHAFKLVAQIKIHAQNLCRLNRIREEIAQYLFIHRWTGDDACLAEWLV